MDFTLTNLPLTDILTLGRVFKASDTSFVVAGGGSGCGDMLRHHNCGSQENIGVCAYNHNIRLLGGIS